MNKLPLEMTEQGKKLRISRACPAFSFAFGKKLTNLLRKKKYP
jgi:hypothetical protein